MPKIVLVMNGRGNIQVMEKVLSENGITSVAITGEEELEEAMQDDISAALIDITGLGDSAWRICTSLQAIDIPFVVLSTPRELGKGSESLTYGARSVLQKPVAKDALLGLMRSISSREEY